jgi:pimeloyl-ACP methyl ester carboxylesterase
VPPGEYDEFALFRENADEAGLAWTGPPAVTRITDGAISALVWGPPGGSPELVLIHGGAQNAHTWDTVALALGRPLLAVDLPGHGHSGWRDDHDYWPPTAAADIAPVIRRHAPDAQLVCGMSLGGLTAICLAAQQPDLVRKLVVIDVTPGTDHAKAEPVVAFISGPESFESFDELLARTIEFNPTRSESSLRRGVLHNARPMDDGSGRWTWRWDPVRDWNMGDADNPDSPDFAALWNAVDALEVPLTLIRGGNSGVVGDEDVVELLRRQPSARVVVVEGAGHSVQGDKPLDLAALLRAELVEPDATTRTRG